MARDGASVVERPLQFGLFKVEFGSWTRSKRRVPDGVVCAGCAASAAADLVEELRGVPGFDERPCLFTAPSEVNLDETIARLAKDFQVRGDVAGQVVDHPRAPAERDAATLGLAPSTLAALQHKLGGRSAIYEHQHRAIQHSLAGGPVMLATATASGKSLCFQVPIIDAITRGHGSARGTALYLGPMKALVDDQFRSLQGYGQRSARSPAVDSELARFLVEVSLPGGATFRLGQYHGGVAKPVRGDIRDAQPDIVFATPDMLSMPMLTQAKTSDQVDNSWDDYWSWFFARLRFIVLDECHEFRGVYGSHVANILRRVRRRCELLGNREPLRYVLCSATIREPATFARELTGVDAGWLTIGPTDDTSRRHERRLVVIGRPPGKPEPLVERARRVIENTFARSRLSTIYFQESIPAIQQLGIKVRRTLTEEHHMRGELFDMFASTYLSEDKVEKLAALRAGTSKGVATTSALALGIDIGTLSCAVLGGYPGSMAKTWQMLGRAGREGPGLLVFVEGDSYFDAYFADHPEELADPAQHLDELVIDPDNPEILKAHLRAAAEEHPLNAERDARFFGPRFAEVLKAMLVKGGDLEREDSEWVTLKSSVKDAAKIPLRGKTPTPVRVYVDSRSDANLLLEDQIERAIRTLYPGAIVVHDGAMYKVTDFLPAKQKGFADEPAFYAIVERTKAQEITIPVVATTIEPTPDADPASQSVIGGCPVRFGKVAVTIRVDEYFTGPLDPNRPAEGTINVVEGQEPNARRLGDKFKLRKVKRGDGTPEDHTVRTDGAWIEVEDPVLTAMDEDTRHRAMFSVGKALERAIPHEHFAAPDDLRVVVVPSHPIADGATVLFIHERTEPGAGLARRTFERLAHVATIALHKILEGCPRCAKDPESTGCIRCIADANGLHDRSLAIDVLRRWLDETGTHAGSDEELLRDLGYRGVELLGKGGQGRVYKAVLGGKPFACKVARGQGEAATTDLANEGIAQEKLAKKYPSAAILRVLNVHHAGNDVVLRLELGEGTLEDRIGTTGYQPLRKGNRTPAARVTAAIEEIFPVLEAISLVHEHGHVHRDVKPGNILLVDGKWKLGDFGIVHTAFAPGDARTFGANTPAYAPRWAKQTRVKADKKHDVYSAACVLSEMLLGQGKRISHPSKAPSAIPPALAKVLASALADERSAVPYEDGRAFRDAVLHAAGVAS